MDSMTAIECMTADEARAKWVAFLREPGREKFIKTLESTRHPTARCCLGHACHVFRVHRVVQNNRVHYDGRTAALPKRLQRLLNVDENASFLVPVTIGNGTNAKGYASASDINDHTSLGPAEIADILEREFERGNMVVPHFPDDQ